MTWCGSQPRSRDDTSVGKDWLCGGDVWRYLEEETRSEIDGVRNGHHLEQESRRASDVAIPTQDRYREDVSRNPENAQNDDYVDVNYHFELDVQVVRVNVCRVLGHVGWWQVRVTQMVTVTMSRTLSRQTCDVSLRTWRRYRRSVWASRSVFLLQSVGMQRQFWSSDPPFRSPISYTGCLRRHLKPCDSVLQFSIIFACYRKGTTV